MRSISERHLAVLIPLLAAKIRDFRLELRSTADRVSELNDEELEDRVQLQDILNQYEGILDDLQTEYESGLREGINLPSFDQLTSAFRSEPV